MSIDLVELISAIVRDELRAFHTAELGVVTATYPHASNGDKHNYQCDVRLRDSGLELKRVQVATQRLGAVAIPNVDDLVLLQYLHGDVHAPIVVGRMYNDRVRPPEAKDHEFVYVSPDQAESGVRRVYVELPNGNELEASDDVIELRMGKSTLKVNHDGEIEIKSNDKDITVTDSNGQNLVRIKPQDGQITVQAATKTVVEAPQIELVANSTHPLVFGDDLLTYLNQVASMYQSHTHPGELAMGTFPVTPMTPVPPFPQATPSLLSMKVKTG